jgi:hypothetical protein
MERTRYTLTYRAAEARQVMDWIEAGQSGCIIGLRGAGKSNFLRFLRRKDVRRHYLGRDYAGFFIVLINLLSLTERTEWAVYELIFHRLVEQLLPLGTDGEFGEEMAILHEKVRRSKDLLTAQRAVARCVDVLCRRPAQRIVLLFDEFHAVFRDLDPSLFRSLRAIRDAHKGQISYIVIVANDLADLRPDLTEVEHFYRLVSRNLCGLGSYGETDARQMIGYLASQRAVELSEGETVRLIELSGGHAGLLKATLSLLWDAHYEGEMVKLSPALGDDPAVQAECRKVWDSL